MRLNTLSPAEGSKKAGKRLGRGIGSGLGKTGTLPKIWDRFYREDTSRSSEGTGLGLAMVKWIAEVHGGAVSAESEVGRGSRFTVRFPIN